MSLMLDTFDGEMYPGFNYVEYPVGARIFAPNLEERVLHYSARAKQPMAWLTIYNLIQIFICIIGRIKKILPNCPHQIKTLACLRILVLSIISLVSTTYPNLKASYSFLIKIFQRWKYTVVCGVTYFLMDQVNNNYFARKISCYFEQGFWECFQYVRDFKRLTKKFTFEFK